MTEIGHQSNFKLDNQLLKLAKHLDTKNVLLLHHSIIFIKLGACAETISSWFVVLFTISRFLIFKSATDSISKENYLSAEIRQVIS